MKIVNQLLLRKSESGDSMKKAVYMIAGLIICLVLGGCGQKEVKSNDVSQVDDTASQSNESSMSLDNNSSTDEGISEDTSGDGDSSSAETDDEYRPIEQVLDVNNLLTLSDDQLYDQGNQVSLQGYRVLDLGIDEMHDYHLLLQSPNGGPLFLIVTHVKDHNPLIGETDDVYGSVEQKGTVNENQINCGFTDKYANKSVVIFAVDKIKKN